MKCIERETEKLDKMRALLGQYESVVRRLERLILAEGWTRKPPGEYSFCDEYVLPDGQELELSLSLGEGSSFEAAILSLREVKAAAVVVPVLRALARAGFRLQGKPDDWMDLKRRTWKLKEPHSRVEGQPPPFQPNVVVHAFFEGKEGAACRYVQVGTKQEPVFELRCGGDASEKIEAEAGLVPAGREG